MMSLQKQGNVIIHIPLFLQTRPAASITEPLLSFRILETDIDLHGCLLLTMISPFALGFFVQVASRTPTSS